MVAVDGLHALVKAQIAEIGHRLNIQRLIYGREVEDLIVSCDALISGYKIFLGGK